MEITDVRIKLFTKSEVRLKAVASVTFDDCFVVHDVKVIEGTDNTYFISMPSKKTPDGGYKDIVHPLNSPTRELIKTAVLEAFAKAEQDAKSAEQDRE